MKILLCAFACSPQWGSEPGVGWRWALELARHHEVVVLTHARFREHIESDAGVRSASLRFEYYDAPWPQLWHDELLNRVGYYAWWLLCSLRTAARLQQRHSFDLIHHLTLGTFRYPSLHGLLGVPFVIGPVGGGERAPFVLRRSMPRGDRFRDLLRDILIFTARFDPSLWLTFASARLIVCKTNDTLGMLPGWAQRKAIQHLEIGAPAVRTPAPRRADAGTLRLLYVGRLIGLKGVHLALPCIAQLRRNGLAVTLEVIGKGPQLGALRAQAAALGMADQVEFIDFMPQEQLFEHYARADVFLFPSLHDSSGGVVYEALSRGLPVVCLDLGGPKHAVTPDCAIVVPTAGLDESGVVDGLVQAIEHLARDPAARARMSAAALCHAERCTWQHTVSAVYAEIEARLPAASASAARP